MVKTSKNKSAALNAIPISKAQARALKAAKVQALLLAQQQLQARLLAEVNENESEENIFFAAVKNARPLNIDVPFTEKTYPKPVAKQFIRDEKQALKDSLSDDFYPAHELESGEELLYLRTGQSPDVLSKLRRGFWVVQSQIDLHGLISDEAREYVAEFLGSCKKRNIRCVRIVHGKGLGSRNREPVLKHKLRNWLMQKDEVIAYAQAKPEDGGSGAVIVLLKA
ncbi:MAG: Smr/MutS family protein [Bdellovibrio sp.]|nr:Smr/MutS family protein [Methylotenera sp.]